MQKQRLELEYPLSARKPDILWNLISTDHGLGRWIADEVSEQDAAISASVGWTRTTQTPFGRCASGAVN